MKVSILYIVRSFIVLVEGAIIGLFFVTLIMHPPAELTDEQLILKYHSGHPEVFETLVKRYLPSLYRFAYRFSGDVAEAEDIAQEVIVKAWKHLHRVDPSQSFKGWMFRIARNICIDHLRKKNAIPLSTFENDDGSNSLEDSLVDPIPLADEQMDRQQLSEVIRAALEALPAQYRIVLSLRYDEGLTLAEIAETLETPIETIKSQHRRGVLHLRKNISKTAITQ